MAPLEEDGRFYRVYGEAADEGGGREVAFRVKVETTDLYIRAERDLSAKALEAIREARGILTAHIAERPEFASALTPLPLPKAEVHELLASMYEAGKAAGTGPMAAVAGTVARHVCRALRPHSRRVLVENGGDVFVDADRDLSYGKADAATVVSPDAALADAVATALGNRIAKEEDIQPALELADSIPGVTGAVAMMGQSLGGIGDIVLIRLS